MPAWLVAASLDLAREKALGNTDGVGTSASTMVVGQDALLLALLVTFLVQLLLWLPMFGRSARGWRQAVYSAALAARMAFIVLLIRVFFLAVLNQ